MEELEMEMMQKKTRSRVAKLTTMAADIQQID
jgi:hypothetical protein